MYEKVTEQNLYEQLLKNEPYPDFASAVFRGAKSKGKVSEMVEFLNQSPNADDQDVLEKIAELRGIKKIN